VSASAWYVGPGTGLKLRARSTIVHSGRLTAVVHTRIENDEKAGVLECVTSHAR
jgi:acyl-coenzyme A thioesterase PaaI-like protein